MLKHFGFFLFSCLGLSSKYLGSFSEKEVINIVEIKGDGFVLGGAYFCLLHPHMLFFFFFSLNCKNDILKLFGI